MAIPNATEAEYQSYYTITESVIKLARQVFIEATKKSGLSSGRRL